MARFFPLVQLVEPFFKGAFFQKVRFVFQISQSPPKKPILTLKFEIPTHISKQLIQISSSLSEKSQL